MLNVIKLNVTNIKYVYYHYRNKTNIDLCIMGPNNLKEKRTSGFPHGTIKLSNLSQIQNYPGFCGRKIMFLK